VKYLYLLKKVSAWMKTGSLSVLLVLSCLLTIMLLTPTTRAAEVSLAWDASPSKRVAGYIVSYREKGQDFYVWEKDCGNSTTCQVEGLIRGIEYCYVVAAYDDSGYEEGYDAADLRSMNSNEVCDDSRSFQKAASNSGGGGCIANSSAKPGIAWPALLIIVALWRGVHLLRKNESLWGHCVWKYHRW
jgi:hypothetical protein